MSQLTHKSPDYSLSAVIHRLFIIQNVAGVGVRILLKLEAYSYEECCGLYKLLAPYMRVLFPSIVVLYILYYKYMAHALSSVDLYNALLE